MSKKITAKGVALALLGGLALAPVASQAVPWVGTLDTTTAANVNVAGNPSEGPAGPTGGDGILQNVTGIDWHANGAGWVQGFDLTAASPVGTIDTFTLTYQAFAGGIASSSTTPDLRVGAPGPAVGTYEYTVYATINEVAQVTAPGSINIFTQAGGSWNIYFDTTPDANQVAGTGFLDGLSIISGTFTGGLASFTATAPAPGGLGVGGGTVFGKVTSVDLAYVDPAMVGTEVGTTLNFPGTTGVFTRPAAFGGNATGADTAVNFVLQTDGFQSFTIPEPGTLALAGMSLVAMGVARRRKGKKA